MGKDGAEALGRGRTSRSLDYLRRRSQHRAWWSGPHIASRRERLRETLKPRGKAAGKHG